MYIQNGKYIHFVIYLVGIQIFLKDIQTSLYTGYIHCSLISPAGIANIQIQVFNELSFFIFKRPYSFKLRYMSDYNGTL